MKRSGGQYLLSKSAKFIGAYGPRHAELLVGAGARGGEKDFSFPTYLNSSTSKALVYNLEKGQESSLKSSSLSSQLLE